MLMVNKGNMFGEYKSELLPNNIKAVLDVGIEDKDTFLGNIIDHERMFFDLTVYINYSQLEGEDVAIRSWEGATSLGIREGKILNSEDDFESKVNSIREEDFQGVFEIDYDIYTVEKEYHTKEDIIKMFKGTDNRREKLYLQKVVEMIEVVSNEEGAISFVYNEPELYMEDSQQQKFMKAIHNLVDNTEHRVVLITKSAIILQDVPSECSFKEDGHDLVNIDRVDTFGENVSLIKDGILGSNIKKSYFYEKVNELVEKGLITSETDTNKIRLGVDADLYMRLVMQQQEIDNKNKDGKLRK